MKTFALIALAVAVYAVACWVAVMGFCRMARRGTAHLDLPADWQGAHPFMPGRPAGPPI